MIPDTHHLTMVHIIHTILHDGSAWCVYRVVLCTEDKALLCQWLCIFVKEARSKKGKEYTPRRVSIVLSGLKRFINSKTGAGMSH